MKIVTTIPIKKDTGVGTLTYFSSLPVSVGDLVSVPLRMRRIVALVIRTQDVTENKAAIKASDITLRKVFRVLDHRPIPNACITGAEETALHHAAPFGAVLASIVPATLWKYTAYKARITASSSIPETSILLTDDEERLIQYRSLIREAFRRDESVMLVVPTIQDAETAHHALAKGIADYTIVLHSDKSARSLKEAMGRVGKEAHPLLVIATPGFLVLFPEKLSTIILERENSPSYKQLTRPFVDFRFFIRAIARAARIRLVLGDTLLSSETIHSYEKGAYEELVSPKWRAPAKSNATVVDMREYKPNFRGALTIISDELKQLVTEVRASSDNLFVFAARKGLAPSTACSDCGSLLDCKRCGHPLVLHKTSEQKRFYLCHRCNERAEAATRCGVCTSWRLFAFGTGTEIVEESLLEKSQGLTVIRLDSESAKNRKHALRLTEQFYRSPGSVLIGTELALPYLEKPIGNVAVASVDGLFSVPDFRINERVMYLLLKLRNLAERQFLLQTRTPEHEVIKAALEGNISAFYRNELSVRKLLLYPPFSVLIKVTLTGETARVNALMNSLSSKLPYKIYTFPSFIRKGRGTMGLSGLMKVPQEHWPDERVLALLRSLPPSAEINVSPENFT